MTKEKTLKLPKNKRSMPIWQSDALHDTLQKTTQMLYNMDEVAKAEGLDRIQMGVAPVPVALLYEICEGYNILYDKLLKEQLIKAANPQTNQNIH